MYSLLVESTRLAIHVPSTLKIASILLGLIIMWIIVSIPVFISAKIIVGRRASFGEALLATLVGPLVFGIVLTIGYLVSQRIFSGLGILAFLFGFIAWIAVYKSVFHTGWVRAFGIAVLSLIVALIIFVILAVLGFAFGAILTALLI
jgi:hypothetical protein